jgi:hypothetical protein
MFDFDLIYDAGRSRQEQAQADHASDSRAKRVHRQLSNAYALRAMKAVLSEVSGAQHLSKE